MKQKISNDLLYRIIFDRGIRVSPDRIEFENKKVEELVKKLDNAQISLNIAYENLKTCLQSSLHTNQNNIDTKADSE